MDKKTKIFLIGFMGSGKTTIGKHLAEQTGFDFVDTDLSIEMQQGLDEFMNIYKKCFAI